LGGSGDASGGVGKSALTRGIHSKRFLCQVAQILVRLSCRRSCHLPPTRGWLSGECAARKLSRSSLREEPSSGTDSCPSNSCRWTTSCRVLESRVANLSSWSIQPVVTRLVVNRATARDDNAAACAIAAASVACGLDRVIRYFPCRDRVECLCRRQL
jgi:hypothetical protein